MKAKTITQHENLKEKIVLIAREIIAEKGLSALTVRAVAQRAGCAVGMVYKALHGIDDILIHVNAITLDDLYRLIKDAVKGKKSMQKILSNIAYVYLGFHKEHPQYWSALFEYHYDDDYEVPEFFDKKIEIIFSTIENALLPHLGNDSHKAFTTARVLWAGIHGICTLSLRGSLSRVKIKTEKELIDQLVLGCTLSAK